MQHTCHPCDTHVGRLRNALPVVPLTHIRCCAPITDPYQCLQIAKTDLVLQLSACAKRMKGGVYVKILSEG